MSRIDDAEPGKFAEMLNRAMAEKNISMKQLAAHGQFQYESFRKLARGMTTPGREMLEYLHKTLGMNIKEAELAATEDRARRRGMWNVVAQAAGKNTELDPIERAWADLTDNDKREIIALVQMKARFNRQHATEKGSPTKSPTRGGKAS